MARIGSRKISVNPGQGGGQIQRTEVSGVAGDKAGQQGTLSVSTGFGVDSQCEEKLLPGQ